MSDFWFRPKTHGYGASPANWKGWAATFGFVLVELALAFAFIVRPALAGGAFSVRWFIFWVVLNALATIGFMWLVKVKTDGEWKWRWGDKGGGK